MALSAIVVTHNSAAVIETCLSSVRRCLPGTEVIVVDNASADDTRGLCERVGGVTVLANPINAGFGRACNQGAEAATGSHLLFLNPDVRLITIDLPRLHLELESEPFGLVGPVFRSGARTAPLLLRNSSWPTDVITHTLGPLRPRELPSFPKLRVRPAAWWPAGAALLSARAEFLGIGGFRREFFLYAEDRDLARRYRDRGLPVCTTRAIVAAHTQGSSSASDDPLRAVAAGWAYLGWIEYLSIWHGQPTARRAVAWSERLQPCLDGLLAGLESRGPLSARARRKRVQLGRIEAFVRWQSSRADGTAEPSFCPRAREIVAQRGAQRGDRRAPLSNLRGISKP